MECPCTKSEIEIFSPVNVQVALTEARWQTYNPINSIDNADTIEFSIPGTANEMVDMTNISIFLAARIKKGNNQDLVAADNVQLVNNALGAIFKNVDVTLNGQLITRSTREYAYKDYLTRLTSNDMPTGGTHQAAIGFYPDTAGKSQHMFNTADNANEGAIPRNEMIQLSRRFELRGRPCVDLFECSRLLLPGTDITMKFHLNEPKFFLQAPNNNTAFHMVIEDVQLYVRHVTIADSFLNAQQLQLESKDAIYPFTRREVAVYNIPTGFSAFTQENIFRGQMGQRYFVALASNAAVQGSYNTNPFELKHFNLTEVGLYENGQNIAGPPIKLNVGQNISLNAYYQLLESIGAVGERPLYPAITYDDFKSHCTVFCFTRSPDLSHGGDGEAALPSQTGSLTLRLTFSGALAAPVTCFIMGEFDSRIQINKHKNIITDFVV